VDAIYAYTNTHLTATWNGVTTPTQTQLSGIPQQSASLAGTWYPVRRVRIYGQVSFIGSLSYYQSSTLNATQGANVIYNASLSVKVDAATDVFAHAVNLFNRQYQDGTYAITSPQSQTLSPPRTISVGLKHLF
jgi:iron complex outermembrane receptor protein